MRFEKVDRFLQPRNHVIETDTKLAEQHIAFRSITESIDTATATGQLVFHISGHLRNLKGISSGNAA